MRFEITVDCPDPETLAPFWAEAVGAERVVPCGPYVRVLSARSAGRVPIVLQRVAEPKVGKARVHLDLYVAAEEFDGEVARLEQLGATRLTTEPVQEDGCRWHVMADPAGNEFCICA
jgi:predicted enzyme related to lactoylglutathione lyase